MTGVCHRAKTILDFEETPESISWRGRIIPFAVWEKIAEGFGFKPDNYYTPAGKMFAEKLIPEHDGRLPGSIACITGLPIR